MIHRSDRMIYYLGVNPLTRKVWTLLPYLNVKWRTLITKKFLLFWSVFGWFLWRFYCGFYYVGYISLTLLANVIFRQIKKVIIFVFFSLLQRNEDCEGTLTHNVTYKTQIWITLSNTPRTANPSRFSRPAERLEYFELRWTKWSWKYNIKLEQKIPWKSLWKQWLYISHLGGIVFSVNVMFWS